MKRLRHEEVSDEPTYTCECCATESNRDESWTYYRCIVDGVATGDSPTLTLCNDCDEACESDLGFKVDSGQLKPDQFDAMVDWTRKQAILNFTYRENEPHTVEAVGGFFDALGAYLIWHPDTSFNQYVRLEGVQSHDRERTFTDKEAIALDQLMAKCITIADEAGKDVYALALESDERADSHRKEERAGGAEKVASEPWKEQNRPSVADMIDARLSITLNRGGTGETKVKISALVIPDIYNLAQRQIEIEDREKLLELWHMAHDLKRELLERL